MYIETSRPRLEGDAARLVSPSFTTGGRASTYCLSFYYHMYGKHIGKYCSTATVVQSYF